MFAYIPYLSPSLTCTLGLPSTLWSRSRVSKARIPLLCLAHPAASYLRHRTLHRVVHLARNYLVSDTPPLWLHVCLTILHEQNSTFSWNMVWLDTRSLREHASKRKSTHRRDAWPSYVKRQMTLFGRTGITPWTDGLLRWSGHPDTKMLE